MVYYYLLYTTIILICYRTIRPLIFHDTYIRNRRARSGLIEALKRSKEYFLKYENINIQFTSMFSFQAQQDLAEI